MKPSILPDNRNEWQRAFEWDEIVDIANIEMFGNETFREN